jgi:16S rRNA (cytosine1402-N4)-methyltransferase
MSTSHVPVLAGELIDLLDPQPGDVVVDCTFGGGGHARLFGERIGPGGLLIGIDRDPVAEERFADVGAEVPCTTRFVRGRFSDALAELADEGVEADLVYLDLGVSSLQIDSRDRGFAYSFDAPLDMRMNPEDDLDAREIVNEWDERRLASLFRRFGEERWSGPIAREIVRRRRTAPLETTQDLVEAISAAIPAPARFGGGHPAKRVFQAIRIAVNDELSEIDRALPIAFGLLKPGGRMGAISFQSLEDRRIKRFFADRVRGCTCPPELPICVCGRTPEAELITRRSVVPTAGEIAANPRAKPARLRAIRKVEEAA